MKCETTSLDIETIVNRIKSKDIDLQPDFQRGEIWTVAKRKKLIDSILRGWKIPPVHFVINDDFLEVVLDGQQRLAAIRDFYNNEFTVDGNIDPLDDDISVLDGLFYKDLPIEWQRRFKCYTVTVIRLTEFKPGEPAELFYRLNQPTTLTSAEQRNAYIGIPRNQVKHLSELCVRLGASKETIGFSNSRLAYDEVISKFCYVVERKSLKKKVTSRDLSEQYRKAQPFSDECMAIAKQTIKKLLYNINDNESNVKLKFNKATLFSWLIFVKQNSTMNNIEMRNIIWDFEYCREFVKGKKPMIDLSYFKRYMNMKHNLPFFETMLNIFNQRTSMGSTDALSVIYRDIILTIYRDAYLCKNTELLKLSKKAFERCNNISLVLDFIAREYNWGEKF